MWVKIAEGVSLEELAQTIEDRELKKGTLVRVEMTLKYPLASAFDLAGAEQLFGAFMPEGLDVKDVYSPDNKYQVIIDCESDPITIAAFVLWVRTHWVAISLVTLGVAFLLGAIVGAIVVTAFLKPEAIPWVIIAIVAGIVVIIFIGFYAYKQGVIPKLK